MNCDNCNHTQEKHMAGEFNCTIVLEKIYDPKDVGTLKATVAAMKSCDCLKFVYPKVDYA